MSNKLIDRGLFTPERALGNTVAGRKPVGATFAAFAQASWPNARRPSAETTSAGIDSSRLLR
ncbi:MAG: hypothetical protein AAF183_02420 [Pseudomonadota bacterium]